MNLVGQQALVESCLVVADSPNRIPLLLQQLLQQKQSFLSLLGMCVVYNDILMATDLQSNSKLKFETTKISMVTSSAYVVVDPQIQ